eukprot:4403673-Prorocentrum_lima.AAC.1
MVGWGQKSQYGTWACKVCGGSNYNNNSSCWFCSKTKAEPSATHCFPASPHQDTGVWQDLCAGCHQYS